MRNFKRIINKLILPITSVGLGFAIKYAWLTLAWDWIIVTCFLFIQFIYVLKKDLKGESLI
jgi:hypothetical protein